MQVSMPVCINKKTRVMINIQIIIHTLVYSVVLVQVYYTILREMRKLYPEKFYPRDYTYTDLSTQVCTGGRYVKLVAKLFITLHYGLMCDSLQLAVSEKINR